VTALRGISQASHNITDKLTNSSPTIPINKSAPLYRVSPKIQEILINIPVLFHHHSYKLSTSYVLNLLTPDQQNREHEKTLSRYRSLFTKPQNIIDQKEISSYDFS
jgi:CRISPR/Cas system-associated protein Cas5 (RAMP superfamily)